MHQIDLSGSWELRLVSGESPVRLNEAIPFDAPGDNITALLRAGLIADPAFGRNELDLQWIGRCDWAIRRTFTVSSEAAGTALQLFSADSLDTVAEVSINDVAVSESDNMFTRVRTRIPYGTLRPGENTVEITFRSPEREASRRAGDLPYPVPHSTFDVQSPHRNLLRKVQCHSGWDWGPSLMVSGVNGRIEILATDSGIMEHLVARPVPGDDGWSIEITPIIRVVEPLRSVLTIEVIGPDGETVATREVAVDPDPCAISTGGVAALSPVEIEVPEPKTWWPAGEGEQPLYTVRARLAGHVRETRLGLRTIEVVRTPDDDGTGFAFAVNGRDIFARGANWIPQDAFPGSGSEDELDDLLVSARDANMNMLRVWGGGTYESDRFYDRCDELGILIWQDFMFACALYPADEEFLGSVRAEVEYQVRRLQSHASLAIWCGNNEIVGALTWYPESVRNRDRYLVDYDRLNEGVIGNTVRALDPDRLFWPSSPAAGPADYSVNWTEGKSGDMHYWNVWHSAEPFASYRSVIPRFCSEFGFQSFPSRHSVDGYTDREQRNVTSPQMEHHQRSPAGNELIIRTMARYYRLPGTLDEQLYLSQVQQAEAIKTAVEYWRSARPHCMGTLFWQLNDTWPTASWASIEYGGNWKLLHYSARRFFEPLLIMAIPVDAAGRPSTAEEREAAGWQVYVVNETGSEISGTATMNIHSLDGSQVASHEERAVVGPRTSDPVFTYPAHDLPGRADELFVTLELTAGSTVRDNWYFLTEPKRYNLKRPSVDVSVSEHRAQTQVHLDSDVPAFNVAVTVRGEPARFTDNNLLLLPGRQTTIGITTDKSPEELMKSLQISTLGGMGEDL